MVENSGIELSETMPSQKPRVMVYLSEEHKTGLDEWAKEERRSVNNLIAILIEDALTQRKEKSGTTKRDDQAGTK
jgi:hypothetical protein